MGRYVFSRVVGTVVAIIISSVVVFFAVRIIPGDPITAVMGKMYDPNAAATLKRYYNLDRPIYEQYLLWVKGLVVGDFGISFASTMPVSKILSERIPPTLYLMGGGVILGFVLAVPLGILAATKRGSVVDLAITGMTTLLLSIPTFWMALLLVLLFALELRILPATGFVDPRESLGGFLRGMILPWFTLAASMMAFIARVIRSSLLDVLGQDYIRTARAKGISSQRVLWRHALKNAMLPAITVVGLEIGQLLGGAIITERVFAYPGMGLLIVNGVVARDYSVIQAALLFFAISFALVNLLTDLAYGIIDPRVH